MSLSITLHLNNHKKMGKGQIIIGKINGEPMYSKYTNRIERLIQEDLEGQNETIQEEI